MAYGGNSTAGTLGHTYNSIFTKYVSGFTVHTFNDDYTQLTTDFISAPSGEKIHSFTVTKGVAPAPTPPPPAGKCANQGCAYKRGATCQCDKSCKKYGNCCSDYDSVCGGGPTPGPTPPTPPSGQCCYYHSTTCAAGDICCSSSGKGYQSKSSCSRYGKAHNCQWTGGKCVVPGN